MMFSQLTDFPTILTLCLLCGFVEGEDAVTGASLAEVEEGVFLGEAFRSKMELLLSSRDGFAYGRSNGQAFFGLVFNL